MEEKMTNKVSGQKAKPISNKKDKKILRRCIIINAIIVLIILIVGVSFHTYFEMNADSNYMDFDVSDVPSYISGYSALFRLGVNSTVFLYTIFSIIATWILTTIGIIASTDIIWIIYGLYYLIGYFVRKNKKYS